MLLAGGMVAACASDRTAMPVVTGYHALQSSTQQRVLSSALDEAVAKLDFSGLAGSVSRCRVNGVFPNESKVLNSYLKTSVYARILAGGLDLDDDDPTYECVISKAVAGATIREVKEKVSVGLVTANVFLQFPTLFTSWYWLPIHVTERYYVSEVKLHVHLFSKREDLITQTRTVEASHTIQIGGSSDSYYPIVEGTAYQTKPKKTKTKSINIKLEK